MINQSNNNLDSIIESRYSTRDFTDQPVSKYTISEILRVSSSAPSGNNIQPWKVYVLDGKVKDSLISKVCAAHNEINNNPELANNYTWSYEYYPTKWIHPYSDRRRENALGFYKTLNIDRKEKEKTHAQHQKNFQFFGAPIGLMFTINRILNLGSFLDYGMFLQNIMLAAKSKGLDTCVQAAWNQYSNIIMPHIGANEDEILICGMSLGWADNTSMINSYRPTRAPVNEFTVWLSENNEEIK